jgi:hypothetical protein
MEMLEQFTLETGSHELTVSQIDPENYAIVIDGVYEAAFSGRQAAFAAVLRNLSQSAHPDAKAVEKAADMTNWHRKLVADSEHELGVSF